MTVTIVIPMALRAATQCRAVVEAEGARVEEALQDLVRRYPELRAGLCDDSGAVKPALNVYLNRSDVRYLDGRQTAVVEGDELTLLLPASGG